MVCEADADLPGAFCAGAYAEKRVGPDAQKKERHFLHGYQQKRRRPAGWRRSPALAVDLVIVIIIIQVKQKSFSGTKKIRASNSDLSKLLNVRTSLP